MASLQDWYEEGDGIVKGESKIFWIFCYKIN